MELSQRLTTCKKCTKRKFDPNMGIVCSLTSRKPAFESYCTDFVVDPKEKAKISAKSYATAQQQESSSSMSVWGIVAIAIFVIRIIVRMLRD